MTDFLNNVAALPLLIQENPQATEDELHFATNLPLSVIGPVLAEFIRPEARHLPGVFHKYWVHPDRNEVWEGLEAPETCLWAVQGSECEICYVLTADAPKKADRHNPYGRKKHTLSIQTLKYMAFVDLEIYDPVVLHSWSGRSSFIDVVPINKNWADSSISNLRLNNYYPRHTPDIAAALKARDKLLFYLTDEQIRRAINMRALPTSWLGVRDSLYLGVNPKVVRDAVTYANNGVDPAPRSLRGRPKKLVNRSGRKLKDQDFDIPDDHEPEFGTDEYWDSV